MADTFYTLQETAEKLSKSESAVKDMVKNGELREYRDGANILFKTEDVDKLAIGDIDLLAEADESDIEIGPAETGEISLASSGGELNVDEDIFTLGDTSQGQSATGSSINILGETDSEFKISGDTKSETKSLKLGSESAAQGEAKIEEDVNLDSFGSGSGLLDLSLQADDTSLGAEVLEDIYSPDAAAVSDTADSSDQAAEGTADVAAEADQIFDSTPAATDETETIPTGGPAEAAPVAAYATSSAYTVAQPMDPQNGVYSILLGFGLVAMAFTMIVALTGANGVSAALLKTFSDGYLIWYLVAGLMGVSMVVLGVGMAVTGGSGTPKAPKAAKAPKAPKPPKPPKAKKEKK
jgi:excisionase family DNA binding protein